MTEQLDPYAVLGVASDATGREISHVSSSAAPEARLRAGPVRRHPDTVTVAARASWSYSLCYLVPTCSSMSV